MAESVMPEETSLAPVLGVVLWVVVPEGLSVAAALDASAWLSCVKYRQWHLSLVHCCGLWFL